MLRKLQSKLSYANVMASIAVFVALGGTGYAAVNLPDRSVGTRELKNRAVTSSKIRGNAVTASKIREGAVRSSEVRNGSLFRDDFAPGQLPTGAAGPAGPAGPPGISGLERVSAQSPFDSASGKSVFAACPAGKRVIGTGAEITGGKAGAFPTETTNIVIDEIIPVGDLTGVEVDAYEDEPFGGNWAIDAYAICANVAG